MCDWGRGWGCKSPFLKAWKRAEWENGGAKAKEGFEDSRRHFVSSERLWTQFRLVAPLGSVSGSTDGQRSSSVLHTAVAANPFHGCQASQQYHAGFAARQSGQPVRNVALRRRAAWSETFGSNATRHSAVQYDVFEAIHI